MGFIDDLIGELSALEFPVESKLVLRLAVRNLVDPEPLPKRSYRIPSRRSLTNSARNGSIEYREKKKNNLVQKFHNRCRIMSQTL